jgi:hypothetical protein
VLALEPGEGLLDHAADRDFQRLFPLCPFVGGVDVEAAQLADRGRFAGTELNPSIRNQVEGRDAFGDSGRMVDGRREMHDPESQPDALGSLAGRGQKHLRCGGMAVLLEEVVLGQPDRGEASPVGELDLVETVLQQDVLVVRCPRAW